MMARPIDGKPSAGRIQPMRPEGVLERTIGRRLILPFIRFLRRLKRRP